MEHFPPSFAAETLLDLIGFDLVDLLHSGGRWADLCGSLSRINSDVQTNLSLFENNFFHDFKVPPVQRELHGLGTVPVQNQEGENDRIW